MTLTTRGGEQDPPEKGAWVEEEEKKKLGTDDNLRLSLSSHNISSCFAQKSPITKDPVMLSFQWETKRAVEFPHKKGREEIIGFSGKLVVGKKM